MRIAKLKAAARMAGRITRGILEQGLVNTDGNVVGVLNEGGGGDKREKRRPQ